MADDRTVRATVLAIGDELTLGANVDTNTAWLAAELLERSIETVEHRTVPDDRAAIADAIRALAGHSDVLIITGGLGPTDDDLTRHALGDVVAPGETLVTDPAAAARLERWFTGRGGAMPAANLVQAQRPRPMQLIPNPHGTAPGLSGRLDGCRIFAMPGPPREMKPMFLDQVAGALPRGAGAVTIRSGTVHLYGLGESHAAERLGDLTRRDRQPTIGTTASSGIITARIRSVGTGAATADDLDAALAAVERAWAPYCFGRGETTLAEATGELLRANGSTLVTAESCTGGWLGKTIVDVPGASDWYAGGWVTYTNRMKTLCLDVPEALLARHGAVSAEVAEAMACGALARSGATHAIAITGVAGPGPDADGAEPGGPETAGPETGGPKTGGPETAGTKTAGPKTGGIKPAGLVYIAHARRSPPGAGGVRRFRFRGGRDVVRDRSVMAALQVLRLDLLDAAGVPLIWENPP